MDLARCYGRNPDFQPRCVSWSRAIHYGSLRIGAWIINNIQPEKLVNVREKKSVGGLESPANSCEVISGDARAWTFNSHR